VAIVAGNKAPVIAPITKTVNEGSAANTLIATVTCTDPEGKAVGNYTLSSGDADSMFSLDINTGKLTLLQDSLD